MLRLLAFAVPAALGLAGVQPLLGAVDGAVGMRWALGLTTPPVIAAALIYAVARRLDRGDLVQPPWYSAWVLLPGAFLLAGAAAMCIFGALTEFTLIPVTMWALLLSGSLAWTGAIAVVRRASR